MHCRHDQAPLLRASSTHGVSATATQGVDLMRQLTGITVGALLAANVCACATVHRESVAKPRRDPNLITREDIVRSGATDAFEALRLANTHVSLSEARGQMTLTHQVQATSRGRSSLLLSAQMLLVVDDVQRLDVSALHEIPADNVAWIRVLTSLEATPIYGTEGGNGAIVVRTRIPDE